MRRSRRASRATSSSRAPTAAATATRRRRRCRASKDSFEPGTITIAGFAENQNYGFGGNSMTEGDKNLAIFGGLGFFFVLLLSGYLMT